VIFCGLLQKLLCLDEKSLLTRISMGFMSVKAITFKRERTIFTMTSLGIDGVLVSNWAQLLVWPTSNTRSPNTRDFEPQIALSVGRFVMMMC